MPLVMETFHDANGFGFAAFNLFVDLFLCTLFMLFLNYRPRRVFVGKWLIAFRLFAILPVAYEITSIMLKFASVSGRIVLPIWSFPLLAVKPPIAFVVFMLMAIFIKTREWRYCRHGRTYEEYEAFLKTNRNSWHFSVIIALLLVAAAIADYLLLKYVSDAAQVVSRRPFWIAAEIGDSITLIFVAPLMLLMSYTRKPLLEGKEILIPLVGAGLILIVALQGAYQILAVSNVPPIDFQAVRQDLILFTKLMKSR